MTECIHGRETCERCDEFLEQLKAATADLARGGAHEGECQFEGDGGACGLHVQTHQSRVAAVQSLLAGVSFERMTGEQKREWLDDFADMQEFSEGESPLAADGFDDAIIGIGSQFTTWMVVYDYERCLEIIMGQGATYEEAVEHMAFNVTGAYVGNTTPVFIRRVGS